MCESGCRQWPATLGDALEKQEPESCGFCVPLIVPVLKVRLSQQWTGVPQGRPQALSAPVSPARHGGIPDDDGVSVGLPKDTELLGT